MLWSNLLSPCRQRESKKSGSDQRSEFQKDYHRIIGSASFRRLQDKTQVFPLERGDFVRTRLTHSLEVSSFASSLGQNVGNELFQRGDITNEQREAIIDILRSAGLIHDIGNPPFGHFGEDAIRLWFTEHMDKLSFRGKKLSELLTEQEQKDLTNFEGNAQALRLLSKLHYLVDENGMNLTYGILNTIIKYPVPSDKIDKTSGNIATKKMGYFHAEEELYRKIVEKTGADGMRHPLAFLLEAADDIAYLTGDIEDAVKKEKLPYYKLVEELSLLQSDEARELKSSLEWYYQRAKGKNMPSPEVNAVQNWVVKVQAFFIYRTGEAFIKHYDEIMEGTFQRELLSEGGVGEVHRALGDIAMRYVFRSKEIVRIELSAKPVFDFLLDTFVPASLEEGKGKISERRMRIISENYKVVFDVFAKDKSDEEQAYLRLLLVTDYLCGMTDSYAKNLYQELSGIV